VLKVRKASYGVQQANKPDSKQSDFIARAIDERNKELATRVDLDRGIRSVKELLYFAIAAGGAALGYIITKI